MIPRDQMTDRERAAFQQGWEVGARDGAAAAETRERLRRDKPVGVMTEGERQALWRGWRLSTIGAVIGVFTGHFIWRLL